MTYRDEPRYFDQVVGQAADGLVARADVSREDLAAAVVRILEVAHPSGDVVSMDEMRRRLR